MFPGVDGFHWTFGHILFVSLFFTVLAVVATTALAATLKARRDERRGRTAKIRWQSEFHDLAPAERQCRHMLSGEVAERHCPNAFECRACVDHPKFVAAAAVAAAPATTFGLDYPDDRFYHRGHTWVKPETDGTLTIGLDDLGQRMIGQPDWLGLPRIGQTIENNGIAWRARKNGNEIRVLAPIEGEVVATGGADQGWYLRLRPATATPLDVTHLLHGAEIGPWLRSELERLQMALSPEATGPALADGGVLMEDLTKAQPEADWDSVYGRMFLEP